MKFMEYTRVEKAQIIRRGGDKARQLEKECFDWLMSLDLPEDVREVVESTDPIIQLFGECETIEEVIELARLEG